MKRTHWILLPGGMLFSMSAPLAAVEAADWIELGNARMQQARDTVAHDFTSAGEAFGKALEQEPGNEEAMVGMAWVRNSEHDFQDGAEWARKALAVDPDLQDAHLLLGDGAVERGDYDAAFGHFQSALDLSPNLASLSRAAQLLWLTGDGGRARELMADAIRAGGPFPENTAWCMAELAKMHFLAGESDAAEALAGEALKLAPENPRVLAMMGRVRAAQGRCDEAIGLYERSLAVTPTHEPMAALVVLHELAGRPEQARERAAAVRAFHRQAAPAEHEVGRAHHGHSHGGGSAELAMFLADHGDDPGEALHQAVHAYEEFPNIRAADAVAWCYYKSGKLKGALRMSRRAMKWNTPDPEILFHAGMIEAAAGDAGKARELLGRALEMNPRFHPLDAERARAELARLGK